MGPPRGGPASPNRGASLTGRRAGADWTRPDSHHEEVRHPLMSKTPTDEPTTEIILRDGSGTMELAASFAKRFPAIAPTPEAMEVYEENLGDEEVSIRNFKRIKVPSGEIDAWQVTKGGKQQLAEELVGVLIAIKKRRSYWESNEPDGSFPDCWSSDGKTPDSGGRYAPDGSHGSQNPRGTCRTCPMSQRGSDPKSEKGQGCREQRLLFLAQEGSFFPVIINAPRTSVDNVVGYAMELFEEQLPYFGVETVLKLTKAKSSRGQVYNKITMSRKSTLSDDETKAAKIFGDEIKSMIEEATADFQEAAADEAAGDGGFSVGAPVS